MLDRGRRELRGGRSPGETPVTRSWPRLLAEALVDRPDRALRAQRRSTGSARREGRPLEIVVTEAAEALAPEHRQRCRDPVEEAVQVHVDHGEPVVDGQVVERADPRDPRVADEDIELAEAPRFARGDERGEVRAGSRRSRATPPGLRREGPSMHDPRRPAPKHSLRAGGREGTRAVFSPIPLLAPVIATTLSWIMPFFVGAQDAAVHPADS